MRFDLQPAPGDARALPGSGSSPLATLLAAPLTQALGHAGLQRMDWTGLARGTVCARRLIEAGLPHCFERLHMIALAVR